MAYFSGLSLRQWRASPETLSPAALQLVTKRKPTTRSSKNENSNETNSATDNAGVTYHCDGCLADISHTVKIRCAHLHTITTNIGGQIQYQQVPVCDNFDLCGQCFCEGKEVGRHKAWHDYRVVERHSIPIFTEDWGADEELLLIDACQTYGLGNWSDIADHVGNGRTKEEVERHYLDVFIGSDDYPLPPMDVRIDMDQDEFQARKKRRLEEVQARPLQPPPPKPMPSAPTNHEIAGFMPGRLDFETEWENEAESSIKELSFGRVYRFGGDSQPSNAPEEVDEDEPDEKGQALQGSECDGANEAPGTSMKKMRGLGSGAGKGAQRKDDQTARATASQKITNASTASSIEADSKDVVHASVDPLQLNLDLNSKLKGKNKKPIVQEDSTETDAEPPLLDEHEEDLELKLTMVDIYNDKYDRRMQAKTLVFDRNLLEYKKIQAAERKMPKEIRDLVIRIKPYARLQTALDHEKFQEGLIYEMTLRKRIADLQEYRRMGITTLTEAERYEKEKAARLAAKQREHLGFERFGSRKQRASGAGLMHEEPVNRSREGTPGSAGKFYKRLSPLPLSLITSASQQLLHPSELSLCSRLRILPKPFLFIKELIFQEHVRKAAYGSSLSRVDIVKLLPLCNLVDEDALELNGSLENLEEAGTEEREASKKKEHKLEAIWDFYFLGLTFKSDAEVVEKRRYASN
ncbi:hypothetical protein O181_009534 [Austropuccinia psidii MF-1]|uniref:Transcriptional adapter 2 n=1 Tax=Austropuccinia psidii MF-1 TaxID=1389203 RepID=A0A9Q3BQZ7_9BASI|nr:hypothetical protein [Austropuccinia psidii MF-1]